MCCEIAFICDCSEHKCIINLFFWHNLVFGWNGRKTNNALTILTSTNWPAGGAVDLSLMWSHDQPETLMWLSRLPIKRSKCHNRLEPSVDWFNKRLIRLGFVIITCQTNKLYTGRRGSSHTVLAWIHPQISAADIWRWYTMLLLPIIEYLCSPIHTVKMSHYSICFWVGLQMSKQKKRDKAPCTRFPWILAVTWQPWCLSVVMEAFQAASSSFVKEDKKERQRKSVCLCTRWSII